MEKFDEKKIELLFKCQQERKTVKDLFFSSMSKFNKENCFIPRDVQPNFKVIIYPPRDLVGGNEVQKGKKKKGSETYISLVFKFALEKELVEDINLFDSSEADF